MFRVIPFSFMLILIVLSCAAPKMDQAFQNVKADSQVISGDLVLRSNKSFKDCIEACQNRILNKFLYEGFEGTAVWRPQDLRRELNDKAMIRKLQNNIYITNSSADRGESCRCSFQLNLASTRKILEDEGYIHRFGY